MNYLHRNIEKKLNEALSDRPVVFLNGVRQCGKSTLLQKLGHEKSIQYMTLDDLTVLSAINNDPEGFLANLPDTIILDEIQRAPKLFIAIKREVDRNRKHGRFILTGSTNIMILPKLAESLTGRMEILTLMPFSTDEINGKKRDFVDQLFLDKFSIKYFGTFNKSDFITTLIKGGYPEVQLLRNQERRNSWFKSYINTIIQREIKDLSNIEGINEIPRLLSILATQSGSLLNISNISHQIGIPNMTLKRYVSLLRATFLVETLPAWLRNTRKRLIKSPKIFLNDSGLLNYLLGNTEKQIEDNPDKLGPIVENFVMTELQKQIQWSSNFPKLYYYRTTNGREVDFVLEKNSGEIVGIEVKSKSSVSKKDFVGLVDLSETAGKDFLRGIVIYLGEHIIPFGKNLFAVPINTLID